MYAVIVPIDLLFARDTHEDSPSSVRSGVTVGTSTVVPLVALPIMQAIDCVVSGRGEISPYYQQCLASGTCSPSVDENGFLREFRRRIRSLRWRPFGRRPTIVAIENDCLIVHDGIESCCLAKALGKSWIKVSVPEEVHTKWLDRKTDALDDLARRTSRREFYNPIEHPSYRRARVARRDSIRLDRIRRLLGPIGPGLSGLDIGCNMGYTSHHLQRQGFRMTGIDFDENHLAVARALSETYGLGVRFEGCYFRQFETDSRFDITLALTVLYHMFFRQEEQNVPEYARMEKIAALQKVDSLTRYALLWESGPDPECEVNFIRSNSGLNQYYSLGLTKGTGKKRELGVFLRPNTDLCDYLKRRWAKHFG